MTILNMVLPEAQQGWTPGANTVAYYPLTTTSTTSDMSNNHYDLSTDGTILYGTYGGVDCAYFNGSGNNLYRSPIIDMSGPFTITFCTNFLESDSKCDIIQQFNSSTNNSAVTISGGVGAKWGVWSKGSNDWSNIGTTITANTWYIINLTYTPGLLTFYINGVSVGTKSRTIDTTSPNDFWIGKGGEVGSPGYSTKTAISGMIIEDKAWSAQEVKDYYNLVCSDYGLTPITPKLPSTYQEVEYIESSGTQYINTGWIPDNNYCKVEMKGTVNTGILSWSVFFGMTDGSSACSLHTNYNVWYVNLGSSSNLLSGIGFVNNTSGIFTLEANNGTYNINIAGSSYSSSYIGTVAQSTRPMYIFAFNENGSDTWKVYMKLEEFKIYSGINTLVRHFVPCYRKADSVIGMYDIVNSQFYTNAGTGTFTKGPDVN